MTFRRIKSVSLIALALVTSIVVGHSAALSVNVQGLPPSTVIDLSAEAEYDWTHWGTVDTNSYDHMEFSDQIGNFTILGTNTIQQVGTLSVGYTWSNGTPTVAATNTTTGVFVTGVSNGFQLTLAADTFLKRLQVYVGASFAKGKFEASLSDGSLPHYVNTAVDSSTGETNAVYIIDYATTNDAQTLTIKFTVDQAYSPSGGVSLQSAVFRSSPFNSFPSVTITSPTNDMNVQITNALAITTDPIDTDGTIRSVEFFEGTTKLGEATNSPFTFLWTNSPLGFHAITAVATDNFGDISESPAVTFFVHTNGGDVNAAFATPPGTVDLTAEGTSDWAHWGLNSDNSFDHKAGVASQIGNFTPVTFGPAFRFTDNAHGFTWYDGTPTSIATNTPTGVYIAGLDDGFEISVAAQTNLSTLKLYVGAFAARGKLTAFLSDKSSPAFFDASLENFGNGPNAVYTVNFKGASPGQSLMLRYTIIERSQISGNVTLIAATLATDNLPPFVSITNLTNNAVFQSPATIPLNASASDVDGTVSKVEFFDGMTKLGEVTNAPFNFLWTNAAVGSHSITARATDNRGTTFTSLAKTVFVTTGGGFLRGRLATPPPTVNLSVEGRTDWAHWGLNNALSFNHRSGVPQRINDITKIGGGAVKRLTDYATSMSWDNGTPVPSTAGTTTGVYIEGLAHGFQLTTPADTRVRRLKVYVGLYGAQGTFRASLSDFSGASYSDSTLNNVFNNSAGVYTIDFAAASTNQTLTVTYTASALHDPDFGNVTFEAATLAEPSFPIRSVHANGHTVNLSFLAEPAVTYAVEYSDVVPGTNWIALTNIIGNGSITNIALPTGGSPQRFYRAKELLP